MATIDRISFLVQPDSELHPRKMANEFDTEKVEMYSTGVERFADEHESKQRLQVGVRDIGSKKYAKNYVLIKFRRIMRVKLKRAFAIKMTTICWWMVQTTKTVRLDNNQYENNITDDDGRAVCVACFPLCSPQLRYHSRLGEGFSNEAQI